MKTIILVSDKAEAKSLGSYMTIVTGTGPVQAAVAASYAIAEYKPDVIISAGSAGSFGRFGIGDIISFSSVVSPDNDLTRFHLPKGSVLRPDRSTASVMPLRGASGYILSSSAAFESGANRTIGDVMPDAADMEAYGVAMACSFSSIPCFAIKMITDIIGENLRIGDYSSRLRAMRSALPEIIEKELMLL